MEESGLTDKEFSVLKVVVSNWYDELRSFDMLKVLFRDKLDNHRLSEATRTMDLLNSLIAVGHLSSWNLGILCDTIRETQNFGLQHKIKKKLPSFPDVEEGTISTNFTAHRQRLMKFGMILASADVMQIDGLYNIPCKEYTDGWSMITDLESRLIISEGEMEKFTDSLKFLDLGRVFYFLTKDFSDSSSITPSSEMSAIQDVETSAVEEKMEKISRKINKNWKKIGALLGFSEEELNVIDRKFLHNASLEMIRMLRVKMDADDFTAIIDALELSEQEIPAEILARGPNALKIYQAALEEGESDFSLVRLMVMGQENVGKTCLINSLLGKKFNNIHIITEVIAMTRSVMWDETDNTEWTEEEIDHKDEIKDKQEDALVTKAAQELQKQVANKPEVLSSPEYTGEQRQPNSSKTVESSVDQQRKNSNDVVSADQETNGRKTNTNTYDETYQATASAPPTEDNTQPKRIDANVREKIVRVMKGESKKYYSLRIWDYGGQLIYHSIHRFYLTPESIFAIVFNMFDKLDDYPTVVDSSGEKHKYYMTNLEYLLYFIRSAYTYTKDKVFHNDRLIKFPVFIIVGTHCKSLTESEVKEKMTKVREAIGKQMYKSHVYPKYFAVENTCASSDESFIELKKAILEIKGKMNRPIPLKWLDLLIAIQELSKEKKIVTLPLKQVESMAKNYGILDDKTIDVAITYLSDIGEIMYHPKEVALKDIVVTQPMEIVEYFRTVFTIVNPEQWKATLIDDWEKLKKGVLTKRLLQHLWEKFSIFQNDTDEKMFQYFVNLMNKFGLICQKKKQTTLVRRQEPNAADDMEPVPEICKENTDSDVIAYYALSHLPPKQYSEDPKDDQPGNAKVSIFHDFCGFLPDHLFHLIVTKFLEKFETESESEAELAYEHAEININNLHYVRIAVATINHRRMFKTTIVRRQLEPDASGVMEPEPETCTEVLSFFQNVLENLCSSASGIQYKMRIHCSDKCQGMPNVENFKKKYVKCGKHLTDIKRYCRLFGAEEEEGGEGEEEGGEEGEEGGEEGEGEDVQKQSADDTDKHRIWGIRIACLLLCVVFGVLAIIYETFLIIISVVAALIGIYDKLFSICNRNEVRNRNDVQKRSSKKNKRKNGTSVDNSSGESVTFIQD